MATPTAKATPARPSGPFTPSASGNAASPSHLSSKTLTRSPAAVRTRAGTLSRMEHSASQQGATPGSFKGASSPAANTMMGTPSMAFGIAGSSPSASVGMARAGSSGLMMGLGIQGADGLMVSDRELMAKGRIREIAELLKDEWGHVSRGGVQSAADRLKLDIAWDSAENAEPGVMMVAGEGMIVTITFQGWKVSNVELEFIFPNQTSNEAAKKDDERRGAEILQKDLQGWNGEKETGRYVKLKNFGQNMEYLGAIDNFGKGGVSCFEALDGVYRSLKEAEEWWQRRPNAPETKDRFEMLIRGPGWPRMHANGRVGLVLDYWLHRWQAKRATRPETYLSSPTDIETDLRSLRIGVDPRDPAIPIQPIRVSSHWFEFLDEIPVEGDIDFVLGQQFPPLQLKAKNPDPTYLPVAKEPGESSMDIDGNDEQKPLPHVLFKASFEPPLPMGWMSAGELLANRLGIVAQSSIIATPYGQLVLPGHGATNEIVTDQNQVSGSNTATEELLDESSWQLEVSTEYFSDDKQRLQYNLTGLDVPEAAAVTVTDFPFSHPMELLVALPIIRMWGFLDGLFTRSFGKAGKLGRPVTMASNGLQAEADMDAGGTKKKKEKRKPLSAKEYRALVKAGLPIPEDSDEDMADTEDQEPEPESPGSVVGLIDVAVRFEPTITNRVHLDLTIPLDGDRDPVTALLTVQPGPEIVTRDSSEGDKFVATMAKVLLSCEDFNMLTMWVRIQKNKNKSKAT